MLPAQASLNQPRCPCILFSPYNAYSSHCILCTVYCILSTIHCRVYTIHCTVYTLHALPPWPLCFAHCILHTVKQYILPALHFFPWCESKSLFLVNSQQCIPLCTALQTILACLLLCVDIGMIKNVHPTCHQWATSGCQKSDTVQLQCSVAWRTNHKAYHYSTKV